MKQNGYMTIYLALTLGVMISLCLALIEGCRYRGICLETECVMDIGMDSILAEYHRELLEQYNLFAVDCSYGTIQGTTKLTEEHLLEYMNRNFSLEDILLDKLLYRDFFALKAEKAEMTMAAFVTDEDGEVFRRMAVDAVEDDVGVGLMRQIKEWMKTIESQGLLERRVEEEKQAVDKQIREYDGRKTFDGKVIHIDNPTEALEEKKKKGILSLVLPEEEISNRRIETEQFIEEREKRDQINRGNIVLQPQTEWEEEKEKILFHEYLLKYMGRYGSEKKSSPLWYQMEYIIAGEKCDQDNLRYVINRIFAIREAANAAYLFGSEENYAVAEALGEVLAAAMMVPEIGELFTISLIFGWAFAESVYDGTAYWDQGAVGTVLSQGSSENSETGQMITYEVKVPEEEKVSQLKNLGKTLTTPILDNAIIFGAVADAGERYLNGEIGLNEAVAAVMQQANLYLAE